MRVQEKIVLAGAGTGNMLGEGTGEERRQSTDLEINVCF